MAVSVMQHWLAVLWSVWTIVLAMAGAEAQPTVTVTMRLAEAEWDVVRQEVLPRFEAVCNCRYLEYGNQHSSAASSTPLLVMILITVGAYLRLVGPEEVVRCKRDGNCC